MDVNVLGMTATGQGVPLSGAGPNQQFSTDMFLQLLVTQLRYQDPFSESQDTGELVTQLTMFTLLEQVIAIQQALEKQNTLLDNQQALSLLNREVELLDSGGQPQGGMVSAVEYRATGAYITVGGQDYPASAVMRVREGSSDGA